MQNMNVQSLISGDIHGLITGGINKEHKHDSYISSSRMKSCINYLEESRKPR